MSDLASLITSIATLLGVLLSVFLSLRNAISLKVVKTQTNGMLKHIEVMASEKGHAAGIIAERKRADDARPAD